MKIPKDIDLSSFRDERKNDGKFLYSRFIEQIEELDKEEFAEVRCAATLYEIFSYEIDFSNEEHKSCFPSIFNDRAVRIAYKQMLNDFKAFEASYDKTCDKNRENGKKGGRPKKSDKPPEEEQDEEDIEKLMRSAHNEIELKQLLEPLTLSEERTNEVLKSYREMRREIYSNNRTV